MASSSRGRAPPAGAESPRRSRSREPPADAETRDWSLSIMTYNVGVPYQAPTNWGAGGKLDLLVAELTEFARTETSVSVLLLQDHGDFHFRNVHSHAHVFKRARARTFTYRIHQRTRTRVLVPT